jgi:AraC-like DNA-binding protein
VTALAADAWEIQMRTGTLDGSPIKRTGKLPRTGVRLATADHATASRAAPAAGIIALGITAEIAAVLRQFGADLDQDIRAARPAPSEEGLEVSPIPVEDLGRLMAACVTKTKCPHFGLLVGQRSILAALGLVGCLMPRLQTVGVALKNLVWHLQQDRDAAPLLTVDGGLARLSYAIHTPGVESADQIADGAMATALNIMRTLCGSEWAPTEVLLPRRPPPDLAPFTRFFQAPVRFEAGTAALVFPASWLHRQIVREDVLRGLFAERLCTPEAIADVSFGDGVRRVLRARLLRDDCSAETVARLFSMHRRTLTRHLHEEGLSFNAMVDEIRFEVARQLMTNAEMTLGDVATALSFSEPSAFTRAFRRWSGQTPTAWRAGQRSA